jgi:acyl carrier protein
MDDVATGLEQCLRKHLRLLKPGPLDYSVELMQLGLDSVSAIGLLLDIEKTLGVRFPDEMIGEDTFRTAAALERAVRGLLQQRQPS